MSNESGFEQVFKTCEEKANAEANIEATFPSFRDRFDLFHFITPVLEQVSQPDEDALKIAREHDILLTAKYLSQLKTKKGYLDPSRWVGCDKVDSRHIMMLTLIFSKIDARSSINHVVEIGAGFGNWVRLSYGVNYWNRWTMIDLPFVSRLQRWYLKGVVRVDKLAHGMLEFIDTHEYEGWAAKPYDIDLVIGAHSLSELSWTNFENYFNKTVLKSKYFFYAAHNTLPNPGLLDKKMQLIIKHFKPMSVVESEAGSVINALFERK